MDTADVKFNPSYSTQEPWKVKASNASALAYSFLAGFILATLFIPIGLPAIFGFLIGFSTVFIFISLAILKRSYAEYCTFIRNSKNETSTLDPSFLMKKNRFQKTNDEINEYREFMVEFFSDKNLEYVTNAGFEIDDIVEPWIAVDLNSKLLESGHPEFIVKLKMVQFQIEQLKKSESRTKQIMQWKKELSPRHRFRRLQTYVRKSEPQTQNLSVEKFHLWKIFKERFVDK